MIAAELAGQYHGTCFYYEESESDDFLEMMENKMKPDSFEKYMDGFIEGRDGMHKRNNRCAKIFGKRPALEWKTENL